MSPILYFAINLTLEITKHRDIDAIENIMAILDSLLSDEEFDVYFDEVALYLKKSDPKTLDWFLEALEPYLEDNLDDLNEYSSSLNQDDFNCSPFDENNIEEILQVHPEDLAHLLLDEGLLEGKDFEKDGNKILISRKARNFLERYYDLEIINPMLGLKE